MSAQLGLVCECVQGTPLFFFRLWKKKPNNQKPVFETAKERKSERERERKRGEVKQRRKSLASLTTLSPLFCVCRRP